MGSLVHLITRPPFRWFVAWVEEYGQLETEFFADPLAYGRKLNATRRRHERGEIETYINGEIS